MKKSLMTLVLIAVFGVNAAYAHGVQQPSLLGGLLQAGNHGSVANVAATVAAPSSLANIHANVLGNSVKADVDVGSANNRYSAPGRGSFPAVADVKLNVLGIVKANVDVGQSSRQGGSLLNLNASVLSGGVGNRQDRW